MFRVQYEDVKVQSEVCCKSLAVWGVGSVSGSCLGFRVQGLWCRKRVGFFSVAGCGV